MEFYGSESTILSEAKPRSISLPKIHKTHIGRHHSSIFAYYMSNVYGSSTLAMVAMVVLVDIEPMAYLIR